MNRRQMEARARILDGIRAFFKRKDYLEVDTPLLAPALIPESTIENFRTDFVHPFLPRRDLYLIPSPELWMKQLLAQGSGDLFQICHAFRNAESLGEQHAPEFTILEWYTTGAGYRDSMRICQELVATLAETELRWEDVRHDDLARARLEKLRKPFIIVTMQEAFEQHAGIDLERNMDHGALTALAQRFGLASSPDDNWQELFNRIFLTLVEPHIAAGPPTILTDFPSAIDTLARAIPGTPWSERWELYLDGRETANCYTEETSPERVRSFFQVEAERKRNAIIPCRCADDFPDSFGPEYPPCSGVALGVDRLIMALTGVPSIRGVIFFPIHDTLLA